MEKGLKRTTAFISAMTVSLSMVTNLPAGTFGNDWKLTANAEETQSAKAEDLTDTILDVTLTDSDSDGYYEIDSTDELFAFSNLVNSSYLTINGELTDDIVFKATPHKARLTALHEICLHIFRYLTQKTLDIR